MNVGSLVKLNSWCHAPGEIGTVIEVSRLKSSWVYGCKVLVKNEIVTLLSQDVSVIEEAEYKGNEL